MIQLQVPATTQELIHGQTKLKFRDATVLGFTFTIKCSAMCKNSCNQNSESHPAHLIHIRNQKVQLLEGSIM